MDTSTPETLEVSATPPPAVVATPTPGTATPGGHSAEKNATVVTEKGKKHWEQILSILSGEVFRVQKIL